MALKVCFCGDYFICTSENTNSPFPSEFLGHLTPEILVLFRDAKVQSLNLTESMMDAVGGLNLLRQETLKGVFLG